MKALLRTSILFFTGTGLSRWLAMIGITLLLLSTVSLKAFAPLGLVLLMITPFMFGGILMRILASPARVRTIPYYRATVLLAGLCALLVTAGFGVLFDFSLYAFGQPSPGKQAHDYAFLFASIFAFGTVLWGGFFWATGSPLAMFGLIFGLFPMTALIPVMIGWFGYDPKQLLVFFKQTDHLLWTCAAGWTAFSIWFVRTSVISQIDLNNNLALFDRSTSLLRQCERQPLAILLSPQAETQRWWQYIALPVICLALIFLLLRNKLSVIGGMSVGLTFAPAMVGANIARRAKFLWLRAGNREQLFSQCEWKAWRQAIPLPTTVLICLLIIALVPATASVTPPSLPQSITICFSIFIVTTCWLYLGMAFTQWNARNIGLGFLTLVLTLWLLIIAIKGMSRTPFLGPFIVTTALACGLRTLAQHRWRTMDWLVTKPSDTKYGFRWA